MGLQLPAVINVCPPRMGRAYRIRRAIGWSQLSLTRWAGPDRWIISKPEWKRADDVKAVYNALKELKAVDFNLGFEEVTKTKVELLKSLDEIPLTVIFPLSDEVLRFSGPAISKFSHSEMECAGIIMKYGWAYAASQREKNEGWADQLEIIAPSFVTLNTKKIKKYKLIIELSALKKEATFAIKPVML